ncbi:TonB-dependent receptor domain-containing protein [Hymenobacter convexus]|uniref:TonB-dependent receptor domain-containing protein n=1 Tax=Hymenobacter sp. CA1UV-4 TaxID=3063782 RepID=UPI00271419EF|nr:TonB-dependent receptor [Hymenobacter sp. CA1UV-4]MDO7854635.1 TonB-dependent receptor [Hymenobacter sp. CA1UV-4]
MHQHYAHLRLLGLLLSLLGLSVPRLAAQGLTLRGLVLDSTGHHPVPYATVAVWRRDSVLLTGTTTDEAGAFTVSNLVARDLVLRVQLVGYRSARQVLRVPAGQVQASVPVIYLRRDEVALREVVVQGERENQAVQLGKQVFTAKQFQNTTGGTGLDLVQRLPAVAVNSDGAVTLRGSENFQVLLNGKPTTRTPADVLAQLAANQVERVEILTSPSARYDGDGKGGIINIITKQEIAAGWSLTSNGLFAGASLPRFGGDATLTYTASRWSAYVAGDYRRYDVNGFRGGVVRTLYRDTLTYLPSGGARNLHDEQYAARLGASFTPDARSAFTVGYYLGYKQNDRLALLHYADYYRPTGPLYLDADAFGPPARRFYNQNLFSRTGSFQTLNADYTRTLAGGGKLTLLGIYEYSVLGGPLRNADQTEDTGLVTLQERSDERSPLTAWRGQADWVQPLPHQQRLEAGYQYRRVQHDGTFTFERQNQQTGAWVTDPAFADALALTQQIHGGYVQWAGEVKQVSYTAGLRLESTRRTLTHQAEATPYDYQALNLFPTLQGLWKIAPAHTLRGGYSRRIDRPSTKALSPFRNHRHAEAIELGDPTLRPELTDVLDASYTHTGETLTLTATAYANRTQDRIFRVNAPYSRTILLRTYTNAGTATSLGGEFSGEWKARTWWRFYGAANVYRFHIGGTYLGQPVQQQSLNYTLNANTTLDLGKRVHLQYDVSYVSRTATSQGFDTGLLLSNAGLRATVWHNQATLGLQLTNVFNSNTQTITTEGPTFYSATEYRKYDRILQLTCGLRVNDTGKKAKTAKTEYGEKDF